MKDLFIVNVDDKYNYLIDALMKTIRFKWYSYKTSFGCKTFRQMYKLSQFLINEIISLLNFNNWIDVLFIIWLINQLMTSIV